MAPDFRIKVYKAFHTFRIALTVFALVFSAIFMHGSVVFAASPLFTVEKVTVDVSAENALQARQMAFEEAQKIAFEELSARMLSENQQRAFQDLPVSTISSLIQDYEVSNEKLSSKRYIGTYKFRFKDQAVKRYFSSSGARYTDVTSKPILILPFLETPQGTRLWHNNAWMQAWASVDNLSSGLVPLIIPLGDLEDVSDIGDDEPLTYRKRNLQAMVARYRASEAVIAIARAEGTGLSIQLYRTDRARPEYVHQILERALPRQSEAQIYERAVQSVKSALRQDWKEKTVVDTRRQGTIQVRVTFSSLQEWTELQRSLSRVYGVSSVELKALSPKEAYLELGYDGDLERLKLALEQADLYLSAPQARGHNNSAAFNADYSQGLLGGYGFRNTRPPPTIYDLKTRKDLGFRPSAPTFSPAPSPPLAPQLSPGQAYQTEF